MNKHALADMQRGEELIAASFSKVVARLKAPLDACMEAAGQSEAVRILPGSSQSGTQANFRMNHACYILSCMLVLLSMNTGQRLHFSGVKLVHQDNLCSRAATGGPREIQGKDMA